jgi:hypothetical protein
VKRKRILSILLITLVVLIVMGIVAGAWLVFCFVPQYMDTQDKMISTVRYIGLGLPDEFYDEVMGMPDGCIQLSELKTKLLESTDKTPSNKEMMNGEMIRFDVSPGMNGPELLQQFAGHIYVKKEGRFLCVAVIDTAPHPFHPGKIGYAKRFELIPEDGNPPVEEAERQKLIESGIIPEDGKIVRSEAWEIDARHMLENGIPFN